MSESNLPRLPGTEPKEPTKLSQAPENEQPTQSEKKEKIADTFSSSDIDAIDEAEGAEEATGLEGETLPARLSSDDFFGVFKMMFALPNMLPVPPFPIKSLPIQDGEQDAARAASDAIYEIACETPFLSWLIEPGSEWMQRAMVIGAFSFGKLMIIKIELDARTVKDTPTGEVVRPDFTPKENSKVGPQGDASTVVELS